MTSWPGWAAGLPACRRTRRRGGCAWWARTRCARTGCMHGPVLASQLGSPLLILLAVTALASAFLGQASDAVIIGVILAASVGMGFFNEYKAAKTAEALHSSVRHSCVTLRDGHPAHGGRDRARPRRRGGPAARPGGPRRHAAAGRGGTRVRRVGADRRVPAGREVRRAGHRRDAAGRAELLCADGHRGAGRIRHRRGGRDRRRRGVPPDRRGPGTAAARDRVPGRAAEILDAARPGGRGADRRDLHHQRRAAQAGHRRAAVLAGDRGRDLPAAAPGGRLDQPGRRVAATGPAQGPGHVEQLREHVQRRRGVDFPDVPAHAALADPAQQAAV